MFNWLVVPWTTFLLSLLKLIDIMKSKISFQQKDLSILACYCQIWIICLSVFSFLCINLKISRFVVVGINLQWKKGKEIFVSPCTNQSPNVVHIYLLTNSSSIKSNLNFLRFFEAYINFGFHFLNVLSVSPTQTCGLVPCYKKRKQDSIIINHV
jgi:hypothetical protein